MKTLVTLTRVYKKEVTIEKIETIGNYAIRIIFSDGHQSGFYSWNLLHHFGENQNILLENYYNSL